MNAACGIVLLLNPLCGAQSPDKALSRTTPVLLARGNDCLVHGITYPFHDDQARFRSRSWGGCAILYTRPSNGEMKALVSTGTVEVPTERISFFQTRLVGVACDPERLYALVWSSGRVFDHPPHPGQPSKGGGYSLHAFWLADGAGLGETWLLKEAGKSPVSRPSVVVPELPDIAPQETLGKGPLKPIEKGVALYGVAFEFEGKKLTKHHPLPREQPAPPKPDSR